MTEIDWDRFPDDGLLRVFHYLPLADRVRLELVNKRWQRLLLKSWADVGTLIVWRQGIYEETSADSDVDPSYVTCSDIDAIQGVLRKAGGNLKALKFVDTSNIDESVVATVTQLCRNLEELELHKVLFPEEVTPDSVQVVENLLTLPRLSSVAWNQNMAYDDSRQQPPQQQQQQTRRTAGGVHVALFPSVNGADAFTAMRGLRRVHLEDAPLLWGNFVFVCVQLAPTLEEFCYKVWDQFLVPLRCTLIRGLQHLTNLKQLNVGGDRNLMRPLGGMVDNEFALFVSCTMPRLERLSMKAAERLSAKGVQALLHNLKRLKFLNLNQCDSVNNSVLESACEMRVKSETYLTIYAGETEVNVAKLNVKNENLSVLSDPRFIDESVFYGEAVLTE